MKRSIFTALKEKLSEASNKPWACFETQGPDPTGKMAFAISYNQAFVRNLQQLGMAGQTDEETVNLFFLQLRMLPDSMVPKEGETEVVNPEATPKLSDDTHQFVTGRLSKDRA